MESNRLKTAKDSTMRKRSRNAVANQIISPITMICWSFSRHGLGHLSLISYYLRSQSNFHQLLSSGGFPAVKANTEICRSIAD
ncbi:hypothetical protein SLE2022_348550 [Rubroshorea leprosula]